MTDLLEAGVPAPLFEGKTQDGTILRLEEYAGSKVAIYFYPEDNTPGCTKQACNLRDNWESLTKAGVKIIGVSADAVDKHAKFATQFSLPFPLIADTEKEILKAYGAWGQKNLYGRKYLGIKRTTFLVNEDGIIHHVIKKPRTGNHANEILDKFGLAA